MYRQPLVVGLLLSLIVGCGARSEVAKDKILAQVDSMLGEIDVKKKEAEISVRNMEASVDRLKRGKIEAKVRLVKLDEKLTGLDERTAQADKTLGRLRDHLKGGEDAEINGKTYTVAQLKEMADQVIAARKKAVTEAEGMRAHRKRLDNIATNFGQREQDGRDRIRSLKQHLDEIDSKAVALSSMQEAANLSGNAETLDFDAVEKQVRDLSTKIDVELAYHDEKGKESEAVERSLESVVRETSTADDKVSEIDKILGGK